MACRQRDRCSSVTDQLGSRRSRLYASRISCFGIFVALTLVGAQASASSPCGHHLACTGSEVNSFCEICYDEWVEDVPTAIRQKLGLDLSANPVAVPRVAILWIGDNSDPHPPTIIYNDGYTSNAAIASSSPSHNFQAEWPEAVVIYTEGNRLIYYDDWNLEPGNTIPFFSPRWPFYEDATPSQSGTPFTDYAYIQELIHRVQGLYSIDDDRVYAAGHSSGAFFTMSMMERMPEFFRAFAIVGAHADYGHQNPDDIPAIVARGRENVARPVMYLMGLCENVFPWNPADQGCATPLGGSNIIYDTIRQLTARNGAEVPSASDTQFLIDLVNYVRAQPPANQFETVQFNPLGPGDAEVVFGAYGGTHSWAPNNAASTSLRATQWVVDFFQQHQGPPSNEIPDLIDRGWAVPTLTAPILF